MFLQTRYSGYNRHNEQTAAGQFLILMQPDIDSQKYSWTSTTCTECGRTRDQHNTTACIRSCPEHGIMARLRARAKHQQDPEDGDFEPQFTPGCPECQRWKQETDALGCTRFQPAHHRYPLRAIVRYVRMRQLGHFMMGTARVGKTRLTLSGSYGHDGLPVSVPDEVYEAGAVLPDELYQAWNKGGGWNGAGSEAGAMRQWAVANLLARGGR